MRRPKDRYRKKGPDAKTGTGTITMMRNAKMDGKIPDKRWTPSCRVRI
jgi:hypothetical protein